MTQGAAGLKQALDDVMIEVKDSGLFVSLCTIEQTSGTLTASGFPDGTFTAIAGLSNIPCMRAPVSMSFIRASEEKREPGIETLEPVHILLNGYYPAIPQLTSTRPSLRAVVDGINYEVMGVEHDSQQQMTRLLARVAAR